MGEELGGFLGVALERLDLSSMPYQMAQRGGFMAQECNSDHWSHGYSGTYQLHQQLERGGDPNPQNPCVLTNPRRVTAILEPLKRPGVPKHFGAAYRPN